MAEQNEERPNVAEAPVAASNDAVSKEGTSGAAASHKAESPDDALHEVESHAASGEGKPKGGLPFWARIVLVVVFIAFLFGYDFLVDGWGTAPQDQARNAIEQQLKDFSDNQDCELRQAANPVLEQYSSQTNDVVGAWADGLTIEFDSYTKSSKEDTVTWEVTFATKQLSTALTKNLANVVSFDKQLAAQEIDQGQYASLMQDAIISGFNESDPIELHMTLVARVFDGTWSLDQQSLQDLLDGMQGDISQITEVVTAAQS